MSTLVVKPSHQLLTHPSMPAGHRTHDTPSTLRVPSGQVVQKELPPTGATRPGAQGAQAARGHASGE